MKAHLLQGQDDVLTSILAAVDWGQIKVSTAVIGDSGRPPIRVALEQKELGLGSHLHDIPHCLRFGHCSL